MYFKEPMAKKKKNIKYVVDIVFRYHLSICTDVSITLKKGSVSLCFSLDSTSDSLWYSGSTECRTISGQDSAQRLQYWASLAHRGLKGTRKNESGKEWPTRSLESEVQQSFKLSSNKIVLRNVLWRRKPLYNWLISLVRQGRTIKAVKKIWFLGQYIREAKFKKRQSILSTPIQLNSIASKWVF